MANLPGHYRDHEKSTFAEDSDGNTAVRVVGATVSESGIDLNETLEKQLHLMTSTLINIEDKLTAMINHLRIITGVEEDEGDLY